MVRVVAEDVCLRQGPPPRARGGGAQARLGGGVPQRARRGLLEAVELVRPRLAFEQVHLVVPRELADGAVPSVHARPEAQAPRHLVAEVCRALRRRQVLVARVEQQLDGLSLVVVVVPRHVGLLVRARRFVNTGEGTLVAETLLRRVALRARDHLGLVPPVLVRLSPGLRLPHAVLLLGHGLQHLLLHLQALGLVLVRHRHRPPQPPLLPLLRGDARIPQRREIALLDRRLRPVAVELHGCRTHWRLRPPSQCKASAPSGRGARAASALPGRRWG
mmetsp:Transcript_9172/g.26802  ORF Transcript_9172/g.26802 Transcript_9172/m.26802 type:complete len:275 (-) Transcript_9172:138-962(-)